jgi:hypothetical protein
MLTLAALEEFSKAHEHTIAALSAVGTVLAAFATVAAILVSLRLARRSETVRLRAVLGVSLTVTVPSRQYVTLQINNMGVRVGSLPVPFFEWTIPFRKKAAARHNGKYGECSLRRQSATTDQYRAAHDYPGHANRGLSATVPQGTGCVRTECEMVPKNTPQATSGCDLHKRQQALSRQNRKGGCS